MCILLVTGTIWAKSALSVLSCHCSKGHIVRSLANLVLSGLSYHDRGWIWAKLNAIEGIEGRIRIRFDHVGNYPRADRPRKIDMCRKLSKPRVPSWASTSIWAFGLQISIDSEYVNTCWSGYALAHTHTRDGVLEHLTLRLKTLRRNLRYYCMPQPY